MGFGRKDIVYDQAMGCTCMLDCYLANSLGPIHSHSTFMRTMEPLLCQHLRGWIEFKNPPVSLASIAAISCVGRATVPSFFVQLDYLSMHNEGKSHL